MLQFYKDDNQFSHIFQINLNEAILEKKKPEKLVLEIEAKYPEIVKFSIRFKSKKVFEQWVCKLELKSRHSKNIDNLIEFFRKEEKYRGSIFEKHFTSWTEDEVLIFLSYIRLNYEETCADKYGKFFTQSKISGDLIRDFFLKEKDHLNSILTGLGVGIKYQRDIIKEEILKLEETGVFDITRFVVQNKVERMFLKHMGKKTGVQKTFQEFLEYSNHFHNKKLLYRTIKYILTQLEKVRKGKKSYKVKFIITENIHDWKTKQVRRFLGVPLTVANKMGLTDIKFGMFHAALSIGPLQIEWVDNSLCLVRSVSSENVVLCVDVGVYTTEDVENFCMDLTNTCLKWNRNYEYITLNLKQKKFHANCQQFVEFFIRGELGLSIEFSTEIQNFMKKLKEKGQTKMMFSYDSNFAKAFGLNPKESPFIPCNHVDLDDFVGILKNNCNNFENDYPSHWELLKGFDRAFWLRHLSIMKTLGKKDVNFKSLYSPSPGGCPFNKENDQKNM